MGRAEFIDPDHGRLWSVGWDPPLRTWFASHEPWPLSDSEDVEPVEVLGVRPGEVTSSQDLVDRLRDEHGVEPPAEVREALQSPAILGGGVEQFWSAEMAHGQPWQVGTASQRMMGYLDPDHYDRAAGVGVLRNLVDARTYAELRVREDDYVAIRATTLRAQNLPGTYDLTGLQAIHRHLFQDVYPWAGQLRTVPLSKAGVAFAAPDVIPDVMEHVSGLLRHTDNLRHTPAAIYPQSLAHIYHAVNLAHPFREGNGRTQREFITALAAESGHTVRWQGITGGVNDRACLAALKGDDRALKGMFEAITTSSTHPVDSEAMQARQAATVLPFRLSRGRMVSTDQSPAPTPPTLDRPNDLGPRR